MLVEIRVTNFPFIIKNVLIILPSTPSSTSHVRLSVDSINTK